MFNKKKIAILKAENRILKDLLNFYIAVNELNMQMTRLTKIVKVENKTIPIHLN